MRFDQPNTPSNINYVDNVDINNNRVEGTDVVIIGGGLSGKNDNWADNCSP